jgi:exosortase A-associated hydrolase 1
MTEEIFTFRSGEQTLVGVVSLPDTITSSTAVLVVVGGPQYRSGSHRQFTLLCRALAAQGIPAMRFDYHGMGDSDGELCTFEAIGPDIGAAAEALCGRVPTVTSVVLWGLCDAASAILFYAWRDPRIRGIALLNPWVYTPEGQSQTLLRHYYLARLLTADFWKRLVSGRLSLQRSLPSLWATVASSIHALGGAQPAATSEHAPLPDRMADAFERYRGPVLLILSGKDLTAQRFRDCVAQSRRWQRLIGSAQVTRHELPEAPHTFASRAWREQVERWTASWCLAQR